MSVIPAKAGIHVVLPEYLKQVHMDSRFRGNDDVCVMFGNSFAITFENILPLCVLCAHCG